MALVSCPSRRSLYLSLALCIDHLVSAYQQTHGCNNVLLLPLYFFARSSLSQKHVYKLNTKCICGPYNPCCHAERIFWWKSLQNITWWMLSFSVVTPKRNVTAAPESVLFVGDWVVTARSSHFRDNGDTNNVILCIIIALNVFVIVASGQGQSFIVFFCVILNYGLSPQLSCVS